MILFAFWLGLASEAEKESEIIERKRPTMRTW
jgi:hypothetical protein